MTELDGLMWPGDQRAGDVASGAAYLRAMLAVEQAWLVALVDAGLAPEGHDLVGDALDANDVAEDAEDAGNPVPALVRRLRVAAPATVSPWIHRGLTSQDVVDSALLLVLRDAIASIETSLRRQVVAAVGLLDAHGETLMAGRTLTQHAVPTTFAGKVAAWLAGLLDAADGLTGLRWPAQIGGAAGTRAAIRELVDSDEGVDRLVANLASGLRLDDVGPWHTVRSPITRIADALVSCTDAWSHLASDVLTLSRPEIAELAEAAAPGRGGSSTMPQKQNPVLSILIRRAALTTPGLAATLHTAAALTVDERSDGAWHVEVATSLALARRAVVAGDQAAELLEGLRVDVTRMRATGAASWEDLTAERTATASAAGRRPTTDDYLGTTHRIVAAVRDRAVTYLEGRR